jgi:hypothetical protein
MIKIIIHKLLRSCLIILLGMAVLSGGSYFLLFSVEKAQATIYWQGGSATEGFFIPKLQKLGMKAIFGGPVTINSNEGHYIVMEAKQKIPELLSELRNQFSELSGNDISIGNGINGGFFTAKVADKIYALMLIRDYNINKTMVFAIIAPKELFQQNPGGFTDANGMDPVAELRPPGSTRVFCFQTSALAFAAYKSINSNLADFYESALSTDDRRGTSIMSFTKAKLPDNGNLVFFDSSVQKGFVVYQSDPKNNCSYAIVCAQMQ